MKYRTIVADPPWPYPEGFFRSIPTGKSMDVKRDGAKAIITGGFSQRGLPYPSMTLPEIGALPVPDMADCDCRLFLWTTNKWLPESLPLLAQWGFRYRQILVWHKADGGPIVASVSPNTAEFLLVAVRGHPARTGRFPSSVIRAPAVKNHSTKPDTFLDFIEQVSPGPYLELFARRQRLGWDTWGDEALEHVTLETA